MKLLPPLAIATAIALSLPLAVSAPIPERTVSIPLAEFQITRASDANVRAGQRVGLGEVIRTNGSRVVNGQLKFGGSVDATLWAWGIKNIHLGKESSVSISNFAICQGGGRRLTINVKGKEIYLQTRFLTQSCSAVIACLGVGRGCVTLRSSAKVREFKPDQYVVGITEGKGVGQDADQKFLPIPILAGQYSFMAANGSFSPPRSPQNERGYRLVTQTRAVRHLEAMDGWLIQGRGEFVEATALPVGAPIQLRSPLD